MSKARYDGVVRTVPGEALSGVDLYVCSQPNSINPTDPTIPPSPLASIFSDAAGAVPITQPLQSDGSGNFFFYADPAQYTFVFVDPLGRIPTTVYPDQTVATPGGGSVSSIGVTVPDGLQVSPSSINSNGVFVISYTNDWSAGMVVIGPSSGPSSTPTRRRLVSADLPAGGGSVTSVGIDVVTDSNLTANVIGSPITTAGDIEIDIGLENQAANTVLAGPTSGGTGPVTARKLVPADIAMPVTVAFSATPVFDASQGDVFTITLTGNVTGMSITNPKNGQRITIVIIQDGTGGWTFAWDTGAIRGASGIAPDASFASVQTFVRAGGGWLADGPGCTMNAVFF